MPPLNAEQADLDSVTVIVRAAGTSFYRGMRVLPPDRRHAMYAIYAFCRMVDDIADEEGEFSDKQPRLAAWRERIAGLYAEPIRRRRDACAARSRRSASTSDGRIFWR